jgi:membrane-bound serine protease (ClpP class)
MNSGTVRTKTRGWLRAVWVLMAVCLQTASTVAQEKTPVKAPVGQFFTLTSPIDDAVVSQLTSTGLELQARAVREERDAVLVLEISSGSSQFGRIYDVATFLTSARLSRVRTVAWLPASVEGFPAILALACHEIVAHPETELGNIGRGEALSADERSFVLGLVDRRRNVRLSRGIAIAMMDPMSSLIRVTLEDAGGISQKRFLTSEELRALQDQNAIISETQVIKESGSPGLFNALDAEKGGFLISKTVRNRSEVAAAFNLPRESLREQLSDSKLAIPQVIAVHGVVNAVLGEFVEREMRNAIADQKNTLIFDIDSPGGDKDIAEHLALAISELDSAKITTVAWIRKGAFSGGALIAFGCDRILMHPEAQIGDVGVIALTEPGGQFERAPEKIVSPFLQFAATLAKRKNRPPALLQAMIDRDLEVFQVTHKTNGRVTWMSDVEIQASADEWVKGPMVPESRKGLLLTVTGTRAHELTLAEEPCQDLNEVRARLGISERADMTPAQSTWVDALLVLLNSHLGGFALMTLGILCLYIEAHVPSGLFAILSALFFSLFFWSRFLGGTAGTLELVLFILGLGLLALEIFVIPGFGVFGISGILLTLASLVMASHTFAGMTATERFEESMGTLGSLVGAMVTVIAVAVMLNRFLPSIPFLNRLILTPPGFVAADTDGPLLRPELLSGSSPPGAVPVGTSGMTASTLRPSGKALFGDLYLDVVSDGAYIDHGVPVEVIRVAGNRIIVRAKKMGTMS